MKIGIWYHDNDYYYPFKVVMVALRGLLEISQEIPSKKEIAEFATESWRSVVKFRSGCSDVAFLEQFLIEEDDVYFDEEIEAILEQEDYRMNSEFHMIDCSSEESILYFVQPM